MANNDTDFSAAYANLIDADQAISDLAFKAQQFSPTNLRQMFTETHNALRALWRIDEDLLVAARQRPQVGRFVKLGPSDWHDFTTGINYQRRGDHLFICSPNGGELSYTGDQMAALIAHLDALAGVATVRDGE